MPYCCNTARASLMVCGKRPSLKYYIKHTLVMHTSGRSTDLVPVPFSLVDKPVVDLRCAQPSLRFQISLGILLKCKALFVSVANPFHLTEGYGQTRFLDHHSFKMTVASGGNFPFFFRPLISLFKLRIWNAYLSHQRHASSLLRQRHSKGVLSFQPSAHFCFISCVDICGGANTSSAQDRSNLLLEEIACVLRF